MKEIWDQEAAKFQAAQLKEQEAAQEAYQEKLRKRQDEYEQAMKNKPAEQPTTELPADLREWNVCKSGKWHLVALADQNTGFVRAYRVRKEGQPGQAFPVIEQRQFDSLMMAVDSFTKAIRNGIALMP